MNSVIACINPIKVVATMTLLYGMVQLDKKNRVHLQLIVILIIGFLLELTNSILRYNGLSKGLATTLGALCYHVAWLVLLSGFLAKRAAIIWATIAFIAFAVMNLFYFEGLEDFNYYTFTVGAIIYLSFFIRENFRQLSSEEISYFISNNYLLLFAPVLTSICLGLMFGFNSSELTSYLLFGKVKLYLFTTYFVNFSYYLLINIYIYREKKN